MICERCGKETNVHTTSWLNTENICEECSDKEKNHPVYGFAKESERRAVQNGDYNFPGVLNGLVYKTQGEANLLARIKYNDNPENIFNAWDSVINSMSYDAVAMANMLKKNHINYVDEAKSWIAYMANTKRVDGRNEASQKVCKTISVDVGEYTPLTKKMARNHPTLQQQYTATMVTIYTGNPTYFPFI